MLTRARSNPSPERAEAPEVDIRDSGRLPLVTEPRQHHFIRAVVVGVSAGVVALLFQAALTWAEAWRLAAVEAASRSALGWLLWPLATMGLVLGAAALTARFSPEAAGSGIPHVKAVLLGLRTLRWSTLLPVKFFGGLLALGAGMSLGREGPTVQLGAATGGVVARLLKVRRPSRSHLISCGAGAGLAAAFNAPLAGFIFVLEELRRELSPVTYTTALIAAVSADTVTRATLGQSPSFHASGYPTLPLQALPLVVIIGLCSGLLGGLFNRSLMATTRVISGLGRWRWVITGLVGAAVGILAFVMPEAVGTGHHTAERLLAGDFTAPSAIRFVALLLVMKFCLTILCYSTGVPGGIFAPMLVVGAALGLLLGQVTSLLSLDPGITASAFVVLGMASFLGAVVRAPLTAIVLTLEMTGNYEQLFAVSLTCLVAYVMTDWLAPTPIYEALLQRDLAPEEGLGVAAAPGFVEAVIEAESPLSGRTLRDAPLPAGVLVVTLRRAGQSIVPDGDTVLSAGDELTFVLKEDGGRAALSVLSLTRAR